MHSNINIVKILLIYYAINLNTQSTLLSKQMVTLLGENRYLKHLIGFLTLIILINIFYENLELSDTFLFGSIIYLLYLLATKLDIQFNIVILGALFTSYIYLNDLEKQITNINKSDILTDDKKLELLNKLNTNKIYLYMGLGFLLGSGMLLYANKKQVQYGGSYNLLNFLLN